MARRITDVGLKLIKDFEGFSEKRYICSAGHWTIGYGHAIRKGEPWDSPDVTITKEEAIELLKKDVQDAERAVLRLIHVPLTDGQFDALVSFCFNLGGGALQRSTLRSCLNRREYLDAADEFPKWCYAAGRRLLGLYRRRLAEKKLFLRGIYNGVA